MGNRTFWYYLDMEKITSDKLLELELSLLTEEVRTSYEKLDELLDDDFIEYGSAGKEYTKEIILERLPSSDHLKYILKDFETHKLSENVFQTRFITDRENKDGSHTISLRSSIWKNKDGKWKMFYHQGTPINSEGN